MRACALPRLDLSLGCKLVVNPVDDLPASLSKRIFLGCTGYPDGKRGGALPHWVISHPTTVPVTKRERASHDCSRTHSSAIVQ